MGRPFAAVAVVLGLVLLTGCASAPPSALAKPGASAPAAEAGAAANSITREVLSRFESDQRARARQAQLEGRPQDAQLTWAAVLALAPADAEALAAYPLAVDGARSAAQERVRRAEQARAKGEVDNAMRWHLEALALDAGLDASADALRSLERERAARTAATMSFAKPLAPTASRGNSFAAELDNAELLLAEGNLDGALALLEPAARDARADTMLKQRTCELLLRRAEARAEQRRAEALAFAQRCLHLLPQHAAAQRLVRTLREPTR